MSNLSLEGRRILVVEDEYLIAADLSSSLEDAGATVVGPASTVDDALALLETEGTLNGAVLDMNLGGESVFPVADRLAGRAVPFVFTTGYDAETVPARYAHVPHWVKPVNMARLADVLAAW